MMYRERMPTLIILSLFIIQCCSLSAMNDTTIRIGVSLSTYTTTLPFVSQRSAFGVQANDGIHFAIDFFNERGGVNIDGVNYLFEIVVKEDEDNVTLMVDNYVEMVNSGEIDFFLGPIASDFSIVGSAVTSPDYVMMGMNAGSPGFYRNSLCAGIATAAPLQFDSALPELRLVGARTVVVIKSNHPVMNDACGDMEESLSENGLELIGTHIVEISISEINDKIAANISSTVDLISQSYKEIDALLMCVFPAGGLEVMKSLKKINYNPNSILSAVFPGAWDSFDPELINYVTGFATWHPNATYTGTNFGTTAEFQEKYVETTGNEPDDLVVFSTIAVTTLKEGINAAQSLNQKAVFQQILRLDLNTYMGNYRFSGDHAQQHPFIYVQWIEGQRNIVSPVQIKEKSLVYPFPKWDEREMNPSLHYIEIIVIIVTIFAIVYGASFLIYINSHSEKQAIVASTLIFLNAVGIGGILILSSIFFWIPMVASNIVICHLRYWVLGIGFSIFFGSMFAKALKIYRGSEAKSQEIVIICVITFASISFLCLFSLLGNSSPEIVVVDMDRQVLNYYQCVDSEISFVLILTFAIYLFLLIICGTVVAIKIHNKVSHEIYNESKVLGYLIYNIFFFFVMISLVNFAEIEKYFLFGIRSVVVLVVVLITLLTLGAQKKFHIEGTSTKKRSHPNYQKQSTGTGGRVLVSYTPSNVVVKGNNNSDESEDEEAKYEKLKLRYKEVRREIAAYQKVFGNLDS